MEELIRKLEEAAEKNIETAKAIREHEMSFMFWKTADLMKKAAEALRRNIPQEMELEGGGSTWWHVCPECHGTIDSQDQFCRHCGQAVK
jgi:hypothetical protein